MLKKFFLIFAVILGLGWGATVSAAGCDCMVTIVGSSDACKVVGTANFASDANISRDDILKQVNPNNICNINNVLASSVKSLCKNSSGTWPVGDFSASISCGIVESSGGGYSCTCKKNGKTTCEYVNKECAAGKTCCASDCTQSANPCPTSGATAGASQTTINNTTNEIIKLDNPLCLDEKCSDEAGSNLFLLLGTLIKGALSIMGGLVLLMLIWGGFTWLTSAGNQEKVKKGTGTMLWAIIGAILILSSYLIVNTFLNYLAGKK